MDMEMDTDLFECPLIVMDMDIDMDTDLLERPLTEMDMGMDMDTDLLECPLIEQHVVLEGLCCKSESLDRRLVSRRLDREIAAGEGVVQCGAHHRPRSCGALGSVS